MGGVSGQNTSKGSLTPWQMVFLGGTVIPFPPKLPAFRPDVNWQEQILDKAGIGLITDVVASSTSADQLRTRLGERTSRVADLGISFAG